MEIYKHKFLSILELVFLHFRPTQFIKLAAKFLFLKAHFFFFFNE